MKKRSELQSDLIHLPRPIGPVNAQLSKPLEGQPLYQTRCAPLSAGSEKAGGYHG